MKGCAEIMPVQIEEVYHSKQIERYLSQVIRAFSNFQVRDGVVRNGKVNVEKVPVIFGSPSRIVAALLSNDNEFKNIKVPMMSIGLSALEIDDEGKLNRFHRNELTYRDTDTGELVNFDRRVGQSLRMQIELNIWASSVSQLMEIFEQVALTFNPEVTIQKSTDIHDADYITSIRLEGIQSDISYPLGGNNRTAQMSMQFSVPIRLSYPHHMKDPLDSIKVAVFQSDSEQNNDGGYLDSGLGGGSESVLDSESVINEV